MSDVQVGYWLWVGFIVSWNIAMLWTARAVSRGPLSARIGYFAAYLVAFGLLFAMRGPHGSVIGFGAVLSPTWLVPLWTVGRASGLLLLVIELAGLAFAWWARIHIGNLWSGMMTIREGHQIVDTGPYRLVRHPIYTGFIVSGFALGLLVASPASLSGAALLAIIMTVKARHEERLLRRELGEGRYATYARRTPMLVPFSPR